LNPVQTWIFFRLYHNYLQWLIESLFHSSNIWISYIPFHVNQISFNKQKYAGELEWHLPAKVNCHFAPHNHYFWPIHCFGKTPISA